MRKRERNGKRMRQAFQLLTNDKHGQNTHSLSIVQSRVENWRLLDYVLDYERCAACLYGFGLIYPYL